MPYMFVGLESLTRAAFKYIIILVDTVPTWIPVPLLRIPAWEFLTRTAGMH